VVTVSRIDKITGLFCRIYSLLWGSFEKETYNFIDPTKLSHPIKRMLPGEMQEWLLSCKHLLNV